MSKYYEQEKSKYSRDVDHLINFKRDGLWIKEKINDKHRFIFQKKLMDLFENLTILHLDNQSNIEGKLYLLKQILAKMIGYCMMLKYLSLKMEFLMRKLLKIKKNLLYL